VDLDGRWKKSVGSRGGIWHCESSLIEGGGLESGAERSGLFLLRRDRLRARLKTQRGAAARDFDGGQGGEAGASPQWAVTAESTQATGKRPAARRVLAEAAR